jgi:hypothetical protein
VKIIRAIERLLAFADFCLNSQNVSGSRKGADHNLPLHFYPFGAKPINTDKD